MRNLHQINGLNDILYSFLAFFLCLLSVESFTQTVQVKYKKFIIPGEAEYSHWRSSPEMKRQMRKREEHMANYVSEYFDLYSDGRHSYFEYDTTIQTKELEEERKSWWNLGDGRFTYSKNLQEGRVTIRSDLLPDSICRSEKFKEKYDWKLAKGKKVFAGLSCQKAFHINEKGDSVIAWYAPELPITDGPESYAGAPGLILAVEAPAFNYIAREVSVGSFEIPFSTSPPSKCLKEEDFQDKVREEMMQQYINEK